MKKSQKRDVFVFDIDGTLAGGDGTVTDITYAMLEKLNCVADIVYNTGRSWEDFIPAFLGRKIPGKYAICSQGGTIFDLNTKELLRERLFTKDEYAKVFNVLKNVDTILNTLPENLQKAKHCINFVGNDEFLNENYEILKKKFPNYYIILNRTDAETRAWIGVMHKDSTKGAGLDYVLKNFLKSHGKVYCFGDANSDEPMLKVADVGVAMGNACEQLKSCADLVIGSFKDDAIAKYIENYIKYLGCKS